MNTKNLALVAVVFALANVQTAMSVPVVPNFTQGSMTSTTETTSTVTETINSMDYNTGWQYSVTGSGCLLYTSPSPRDKRQYRMPSSA